MLPARAELGEGMREAESRFAEDEAARFDVLDSPGDPRTLYAFLQMRFPSDPWTEDGYRIDVYMPLVNDNLLMP